MNEDGRLRASAFDTILYGGLAIGILDFLDASIFFPLYFGISFTDVWHGPASGVIGREASRAGGWQTAILGIFLHFCVAFSIAAVYYLLTRFLPLLLQHPVIWGLIFGIAAHFVMQYVVVPISAIGTMPKWPPVGSLLNSLIGHALLVGLPVALIAAWSAKRNKLA
ncbi:MAG: hypothetical protein ACJ72Z_00035 [Pyrinomonadaceae bacterium]